MTGEPSLRAEEAESGNVRDAPALNVIESAVVPHEKLEPRTAVLVFGPPRSGASAVAKILNFLGCQLPADLVPADEWNKGGYWESRSLRDLNAQMLASGGGDWADWQEFNPKWFQSAAIAPFRDRVPKLLKADFGDAPLIVIKDPRQSLLAPFWIDALQSANVTPMAVHVLRDPLEVVESLAKRNGFGVPRGLLLWLRYMLAAEFSTRGLKRVFVSYGHVMQDYGAVVDRTEKVLDMFWPRRSERVSGEIANFLSGSLRHHRNSGGTAKAPPYAVEWISQVHAIIASWAEQGENIEHHATLDRIRTQFSAAAPAFGKLVRENDALDKIVKEMSDSLAKTNEVAKASRESQEKQIADLKTQLSRLTSEDEKRAARLIEIEKKLAEEQSVSQQAKQAAAAKSEEAKQISLKFSASEADRDALIKRQAAAEEKLSAVQAALEDAQKVDQARTEDIHQYRERLEAQARNLEQMQGEKTSLLEDKAGLADEKATLEKQVEELAGEIARLSEDNARNRENFAILTHEKTMIASELDSLGRELDAARQLATTKEGEVWILGEALAEKERALDAAQLSLDGLGHEKGELESRFNDVQAEAVRLNDMLGSLHDDSEAVRAQLADRDEQLLEAQSLLLQAKEELTKRLIDIDELRQVADERMTALADQDRALADGAVERDRLRDAKEIVEADLKVLQGRFEQQQEEIAKLRKESERLEAELDRQKHDFAEASGKLAETQSALRQRQLETEQTAEELKDVRKKLGEEQEARSLVEAALATSQAELLALAEALDATQIEHAAKEQVRFEEIAILSESLKHGETALGELRNQLEQSNKQLDAQMAVADELRAKAAADADSMAALTREIEDLRNKGSVDEQAMAALSEQLEAGLSALTETQYKLVEQERAVADLRTLAERDGASISQLSGELETTQRELDLTRAGLSAAQQKASQLSNELDSSNRTLNETYAHLSDAREEASQLSHRLDINERSLTDTRAYLSTARQGLAQLKVVKRQLSREIELLKASAASVRADAATVALYGRQQDERLCEVMNALLAEAARPFFTKKMIQRRQQAILEKYGLFDPEWYSQHNPDVAGAGFDPVEHFLAYGLAEGRPANQAASEIRTGASRFTDNK